MQSRIRRALESGRLQIPESEGVCVFAGEAEEGGIPIPAERARFVQTLKPNFTTLEKKGLMVSLEPPERCGMAIVQAARSRAKTLGIIARAMAIVEPGATIAVDGARRNGIDGFHKACKSALKGVQSETGGHGRLFWFENPAQIPGECRAWIKAAGKSRNRDGYMTAPGSFSSDGVDPGSRLLASRLNGLKGKAADLGAGWGYLSDMALRQNPKISRMDLIEADHDALSLAMENVSDQRARFIWDDVQSTPEMEYDTVITNPPFHTDGRPNPKAGMGFMQAARRALKPGGRLLLVANRRLPYEVEIKRLFGNSSAISEEMGYKVILATSPRGRASKGARS